MTQGMQRWTLNRRLVVPVALVVLLACAGLADAQIANQKVQALEGVGVDEKLDATLPLDLKFTDADGKTRSLGSLFQQDRPVILSLNYSDCPMLCQLQLNGLVEGVKRLRWTVGEQFDVISVSIDPKERWQRARETKQRYVKQYGRPGSANGWQFLVSDEQSIQRLAEAVGFGFRYVPERGEYAHAAVVMLCTPEGRVSRYLYGVDYPPTTLKLSLVEAGEGKIGSTLDQVLLFCFHYDAESGRYGPVARRLMQVGGVLTLLTLLVGLTPYWWRRRRGAGGGPSLKVDRMSQKDVDGEYAVRVSRTENEVAR
jgi:protein SCO1/2